MNEKETIVYESEESLLFEITKSDGQKHLLKVLRSTTPSPDQILSFNNEYEFTKDLSIPGVRKALYTTKYENQWAIAFEFIDGDTIENVFAKRQTSVLEQLKVYATITKIIAGIHSVGIIHKDINGRNIIWNNHNQSPVIIDFGISTHIDLINTNLGNPDRVKGTLSHMSPEQTGRVNRKIDSRSDLYSLGVTMYRSLTGQLPFSASDSLELVHYQLAKAVPQAHLLNPKIPVTVSNIIIKLMAKNAEDRYQSALGLLHDIEYCIRQLENEVANIDFKLGVHDVSGKFQIPQKLYGRDKEVETLLKSFDTVSEGSTEWFLVSGYSGVGKSVLIGELYKPITERRGYIAEGKFDQYQRNIPYYAFTLAINEFCSLLLTESKEKLLYWKNVIQQGLGDNGSVILEVAPALKEIIGEQPEPARLDALEALNRFNTTFVNFVRAIAKADHPFVFFIDDLQWADVGSLNLIKTMACDLSLPYLMVIGAYRDNEVTPGHPLLLTIDAAIKEKAIVKSIQLKPLLAEHVFQLVKDVLHTEDKITLSLTEIIFSKTQGNAFFTIEFLKSLHHFNLVVFKHETNTWLVNFDEIKKRKITDNVIDFLVSKINELPVQTQHVLQLSSCISGLFDLELLSTLYDKKVTQTLADLWPAVTEGLIFPVNDNYKLIEHIDVSQQAKFEFAHDRVQQASYTLMSATRQAAVHLQIGRLLLKNHTDDVIFDIVNHCNEGLSLIESETERKELAQLNLKAAKQAKNSSAYKSALVYITAAQQLTGNQIWQYDYPFALELFTTQAEIDYLNGNLETSQTNLLKCIEKAQTPAEKSGIYFMLMQNQNNGAQYYEAIESARQGLHLLNFKFPQKDDCPALIPAEMGKIITYFAEHGVASVFEKPNLQTQDIISTINILDNLSPPTYVTGETNMWILHVLFKINITITHGLSPQGGYAFSELGLIFFIMGNYEYAYPAAMLSKRIAEKFKKESPRNLSRSGHLFTNYNTPWVKHISETAKLNPEYYQVSIDCGEMVFAGYTSFHPFFNSYFQGNESLQALLLRIPDALEFTKKIKHDLAHDSLRALQLVMSNLAGATISETSFDLPNKTGADLLQYCKDANDAYGATMFHLYKAQAYYLYGNLSEASYCLQVVASLPGVIAGNVPSHATFNMLYALTLLGMVGDATETETTTYWTNINTFKDQLKVWSSHNASNFEHKYFLVEAECLKVQGETLKAIEFYAKAIESAELYDFDREVALTHQKAGEFWIKMGNKIYAQPHLERARYLYNKLGYQRLVKSIDDKYPFINKNISSAKRTDVYATLYSSINTADLAGFDMKSVMKASHALSEEIVYEKLLSKILRIVIENAGGQRAVLILNHNNKWQIEADFSVEDVAVQPLTPIEIETSTHLPISVINYVIRTRTQVLSFVNSSIKIFERDTYFKTHKPASYMCLPLSHKGATNGIIYVEHRSNADAFSNERLGILELLTSQMSVSIENAMLYKRQFELNKAYQRFVPHDFINAIGRQSILEVKLGDHIKRDMIVMFCDIRSYSTMSEGMTTEENFSFINAYLQRVGPVIQKSNGFINHYFGDGFIALFKGEPESALNAAIEILNEIEVYNTERLKNNLQPIAVGIGLHKGPIMMGIIGDDQRHDANVLSDAVNIASRLEGLTKIFGANVVLSESLYQALENIESFQFRHLGRIKVKGKHEVMSVFEMFSADSEKVRLLKNETLEIFNRGIADYFNKRFAEAALSLRQLLDVNPDDKSAKRYLQNAARFMVEGVGNDWDGVEQMSEK